MELTISSGHPHITLGEGRFSAILTPSTRLWVANYIIMSLLGYERCATCLGRITRHENRVEGYDLLGYECESCHSGFARVISPEGAESQWDSFSLRGTPLPYVCSRRPMTEVTRPYFPAHGMEGSFFGVRWNANLYTQLCPLGLYVLKYAFTDMFVHNRIGAHLSMVRSFGPSAAGFFVHSNWLILDTDRIQLGPPTSMSDWSGIQRRLTHHEFMTLEPSLRLGVDVANEMSEIRRGRATSSLSRAEFRNILQVLGLNNKVYKADPAWRAKVETTLAGFGDVKKLLK